LVCCCAGAEVVPWDDCEVLVDAPLWFDCVCVDGAGDEDVDEGGLFCVVLCVVDDAGGVWAALGEFVLGAVALELVELFEVEGGFAVLDGVDCA
jgi:hypothetical protein